MKKMIPPPFTRETAWLWLTAFGVQLIAVLIYFNRIATALTLAAFGVAALISFMILPRIGKTNARSKAKKHRRLLAARPGATALRVRHLKYKNKR
jgi:hypothetical protein